MSTTFRLLVFVFLPLAMAFGQENPTPSPTPEATPTPEASPAPSPEVSAEATPAPSPEATASPTPDSSPAPTATPADTAAEATPTPVPVPPGEDVIPLPGDALPTAVDGAPLDTQPIVPDQAPSDNTFIDPNSIIPEEPPALTGSDGEAEKQRALTIRYTEVRTQAEKDPKVVNLKKQADEAKSDEAKRAAMREYYRLLFKKMIATDKTLEAKCKALEEAYIRRLAQTRLEPTIPLNPPPTPEPIN